MNINNVIIYGLVASVIHFIVFFVFRFLSNKKFNYSITFLKNEGPLLLIYYLLVNLNFLLLFDLLFKSELAVYNIKSLFFIAFAISITLSVIILAPIILFWYKNIKKRKIYNDKYNIKEIKYYRDLFGDIQPSMIALLNDNLVNYDDIVISDVIYLIKNNVIEIKDDDFKLIKPLESLVGSQKILVRYLTGRIPLNHFKNDYKKALYEELNDNELIEKGLDPSFNTHFIEIIMGVNLLAILYIFCAAKEYNGLILGAFFINFIAVAIVSKLKEKDYEYSITSKGATVMSKIEALKKYLKDFTIINERKIKDYTIYDDYIIFAILFNLTGNLNDEVKKQFDEIKKITRKNYLKQGRDNLMVHKMEYASQLDDKFLPIIVLLSFLLIFCIMIENLFLLIICVVVIIILLLIRKNIIKKNFF